MSQYNYQKSQDTSHTDKDNSFQKDTTNNKNANNFFDFINQKTEKLSTAIYMVTSYMHDDEPVRSTLRVSALSTVGHAAHLSIGHKDLHIENLKKDIKHIIALVTLSETISLMSHMNADILKSEYEKILDSLNFQKDNQTLRPSNIEHEFDYHYLANRKSFLENSNKNIPDYPKIVEADYTPALTKNVENQEQKNTNATQNVSIKNTEMQNKFSRSIFQTEGKDRKDKRKDYILKILSTSKEMSIKDVSNQIEGCSEKTVQRELNDLVDLKKIKRIGEKRWSRYIKI